MTHPFGLRAATDDDYPSLVRLVHAAFLDDMHEGDLEVNRLVFEPDRTQIVIDNGAPVATGRATTRDLSIPGGTIPAAHITAVAVAATHRRRGLLTSIMDVILREVNDRSMEPLAVLWASEGSIYGRFGYGLASWRASYDIRTRETSLPGTLPDGARLRSASPREVIGHMSGVLDQAMAQRPGLSSRPGRWWDHLTADLESSRQGMSVERAVLYEMGDQAEGYVRYRTKMGWDATGPQGEVKVTELVATTPQAYASLWRYLISIDLVRTLRYPFAAVDEPLPYLFTNQMFSASHSAALWIRILDVPAALAARRYAAPIDVVLEISDAAFPDNAGRWRLAGDEMSASCQRTDDDPHLSLDIRELGSIYLGGVCLTSLAAGGLVTERASGSVDHVSAAFGWRKAPCSIEDF